MSTFLTNNNQNEKTKDYQGKFARSLAGYRSVWKQPPFVLLPQSFVSPLSTVYL